MTDTKTPTIEDLAARVAALEARPKRVLWAEEKIVEQARALALMRRGGYEVDSSGNVNRHGRLEQDRYVKFLEEALLRGVDDLIDAAMLASLTEGK